MIKAKRGMISPYNLFFIFVICRVVISLTYVQSVSTGNLTSDMAISALLALLFTIIISLPALFCIKNNKNPMNSKILRAFYGMYFIFLSAVNVSRFAYFASTRLNPEAKGWIFALLITVAAAYAAYLGIEGIARFSSFAFVLVVLMIGILLIFNTENFEFINLLPFGVTPAKEVLGDTLIITSNTIEIPLLLILAPKINGGKIKPFLFSMTMAYGIITLLFVFVVGVLGDSASLQSFPVYTLAQLASLGDFRRLDAVYMAFWIFAIFVKAAVLLYSASVSIERFSHKSKCVVIGIVSFIIEVIITASARPDNFNYEVIIIPFFIFSLVLPSLYLIFGKKKRRRNIEDKI